MSHTTNRHVSLLPFKKVASHNCFFLFFVTVIYFLLFIPSLITPSIFSSLIHPLSPSKYSQFSLPFVTWLSVSFLLSVPKPPTWSLQQSDFFFQFDGRLFFLFRKQLINLKVFYFSFLFVIFLVKVFVFVVCVMLCFVSLYIYSLEIENSFLGCIYDFLLGNFDWFVSSIGKISPMYLINCFSDSRKGDLKIYTRSLSISTFIPYIDAYLLQILYLILLYTFSGYIYIYIKYYIYYTIFLKIYLYNKYISYTGNNFPSLKH